MTPSTINPRVLELMHAELLTTPDEMNRIARLGLILVRASDFVEQVAIHFGADAVYILNEFYRNFLGKYSLICVSRSPYSIRLCDQVTDGGQEGVQLSFTETSVRLTRLTANFGTTTFTLIKEYIL